MDAAPMKSEEFFLLLQGWRGSRLRVAARSPDFRISVFATVLDVRESLVAFWVGAERDKNAVEFVVRGCFFGFRDAPPDEAELPVGAEIESMIGAVREDFDLLIMLLK